MKRGWWIKYAVLTIFMSVVWLLCLNSVPADDPGDIVGVGFTCAIPPLIYIMLFLGFVIHDLKKR
jgi:hypothetical protein